MFESFDAADLMPEVNREPGIVMAVWVFVGVGLMLVLRALFPVLTEW